MNIIISNNSIEPIYIQITSQIKKHIMNGKLKTGDPIPSMRSLAKSLQISVITVQRAYEELKKEGFIESIVGHGTFVSAKNKDILKEEKRKEVEAYLESAADLGRIYGIDLETMKNILGIYYGEEI